VVILELPVVHGKVVDIDVILTAIGLQVRTKSILTLGTDSEMLQEGIVLYHFKFQESSILF